MRKLQLRLRSWLWKSLANYVLSSALRFEISGLNFGIPGLERGCRHLGVRQSEDNSDGNRGLWRNASGLLNRVINRRVIGDVKPKPAAGFRRAPPGTNEHGKRSKTKTRCSVLIRGRSVRRQRRVLTLISDDPITPMTRFFYTVSCLVPRSPNTWTTSRDIDGM